MIFISRDISDLSERGTYWHLATRQEELQSMQNLKLKKHAHKIDDYLRNLKFQTLVHGDAKLPNFCFGEESVAAVDFQYVGPGCGLADLWYLFRQLRFEKKICKVAFEKINLLF